MNLDSLSPSDETRSLHLLHPISGEPLFADDDTRESPMLVEVYGSDSSVYNKAKNRAANRRIKKMKTGGIGTAENLDSEGTDILVACVAGWRNLTVNDAELEYSPAAVRQAFERFPWIKTQVDDFAGDLGNFVGE